MAFHLIEWIPDYALVESELQGGAGSWYAKLNQAAVRVYTSKNYKKRGEIGEIALHAICRQFYNTIPISPRVFYKSASNDPVKAFDMVHARIPEDGAGNIEIWLGESKFYKKGSTAIRAAIESLKTHVSNGFLTNERVLIGPQISKDTPRYEEIASLFHRNTSIDKLLEHAVFPVGILCNSDAVAEAKESDAAYLASATGELHALATSLFGESSLAKLRLKLIYIPLGSKLCLLEAFDKRIKALQ